MALQLNYSSFDFNTIKQNLITLLENDPVFKDYNFGGSNINTFIELISGIGDLFNFYINAMADESYIQSSELYETVNKLVNLIGYNPSGYTASSLTVDLSASIDFSNDDDYFEIPKWTGFSVFSTSPEGEDIKYTNPSKVISVGVAGTNIFDDSVFLIQGIKEVSDPYIGTGNAFQTIEIEEDKAIEGYIEVTIDDVVWTYVENLHRNVDSTSKVFTTRYNKNKKVELSFGDGVFGVIPPMSSEIIVTYIKTLGVDGQIGANEVTEMDTPIVITLANGTPTETEIDFIITQTDASDGGRIPLSIEEVREYGPKSFRTQDRVVTSQDHEDILISEFSEYVLQAIVLSSDDYFDLSGESPSTSGNYYNNAYLYVLPITGNTITGNLQQEMLDFLEDYKMATLHYNLKNVDFRDIDTDISFKRQPETVRTVLEVSTDIETTVKGYFSRSERKISEDLKYSDLLSQLQSIEGISSLTLSLSSDLEAGLKYENIEMGLVQFPILNNLTIASAGTGE
jgi:hypothetical protein